MPILDQLKHLSAKWAGTLLVVCIDNAPALHFKEERAADGFPAEKQVGAVLGTAHERIPHLLIGVVLNVAPVLYVSIDADAVPALLARICVKAGVLMPVGATQFAPLFIEV